MQFFATIVDPSTCDRADVVVDADERAHIEDLGRVAQALFRDAGHRTGGAGSSAMLYVDGEPIDPSLALAASAVREGAWISLDDPAGCPSAERPGLLEVRVVGGPAVGTVHHLSVGTGDLGGARDSWVSVADPAIPPTVAVIDVDAGARCWIEPTDAGAVRIDGDEIQARIDWRPGEQLTVGSSVLEIAVYSPPDAALQPSIDGNGLDYNRPPRILPPRRQTRFRLPAPPKEPQRSPLPWLMAAAPLIGAFGLMALTGNKGMLLFALLSPISIIANYVSNRRRGRRTHAQLMREYRDRKAAIESDAREALATERVERRHTCPDPAAVLVIATGPYHRLWERRRRDQDHLLLRVGSAEIPSEVTIEDPEREEHRRTVHWHVPEAPVTLPLRERGVIGLAGPGDTARALGRWVVVQAAVLHSPADLQIVLLTDLGGQETWDWVRWLPHARSAGGQGLSVLIGTDADSVARRVSWLLELVNQRTSIRNDTGAAGFREPDVLVVFDGSRRLRSLPGVVQMLRQGPAVGVHAVCIDADERLLPAECQAVAVAGPGGLRVAQIDADEITGVRPEYLPAPWCERVARALAPIRDVSDDEDDASLPASSRLLDVLSLDPPQPQAIAARWSISGRSTAVVVGESFDGPFEIDLRRDGPHGLIAGTTGSGKSELLQTVVASLAVANRPDAMTFVLVDYKGGSAFGDCVRLPHTVGMVTDLDEHLVRRALESLSAELRRREHLLAAAGAKDIEDYTLGTARQPDRAPLPRLLIVIDEFASMVRDLPDFVTGLVNIAQRGRSLGIHLLLATQRPSGVVSPEIRANTNLRIALRVTDAAESQDVLNASDAARIARSTPGRAFVRLGHASLVPFQASRVGGRRAGPASQEVEPPRIVPVSWTDLGRPIDVGRPVTMVEQDDITDLQVLVEALREATALAGVPPQHSPWLPALPEAVTLDQLEPAAWNGRGLRPVPYGVDDLPAQQARRTAVVDFATFGHLMAAGAPRTGRSQLLRTVAGSVAATHSCADVHLYGLDCGNGALLPLAALPHCGAVVSRTEVERAVRLIRRLGEEIRRRQGVLAAGGWADITEQRAAQPSDRRLAHLVLLLDRWEGFMSSLGELDAGALGDEVFTMLREGASVGVHLVITGDRSLLTGRISTLTEEKLSFRLADRGDMSLIGLIPRNLPENIEPGRAFRAESGIETQVALLGPDPSGAAQAAVLAACAASTRERDATVPASLRPFRLGDLPTQISFAEASALPRAAAGPGWVLAGVGGDQLTGYGPDLATGVPAFAVGGPAKSGRSTMLVTMLRSALEHGQQAILLAPRTSPLRALAGTPGIIEVFTTTDVSANALADALALATDRTLIAIDDAGALRDCDASGELRDVLRTGEQRGLAIVFAGDPEDLGAGFSGWLVDARRSRRGALLSPQNRTDGDLIGIRLDRTAVGRPVQPGRALLHVGDGEPIMVQVPV